MRISIISIAAALRKVAADQPIVVPTGVGNLVHDLGFNIVHELDHWQRVELGPLCVSLTPCHHWGARLLHDSHRGFGGFVIEAEGRSIFHCGDSAYFEGFAEIGKRFDDRDRAPADRRLRRAEPARSAHESGGSGAALFSNCARRNWCRCITALSASATNRCDEPPARLLSCAREHGIEEKVLVMTEGTPVVL